MVQRCFDSNHKHFHSYGGRGITVCERWLGEQGFANFLADMGPRPSAQHSIDRFPDNDGNYGPDNCRWATSSEQNRNRRDNHLITADGETMCIAAWAERTGIHRNTLFNRLRLGWTDEETVESPRHG